ncbi:hypothetical protein Tco_0323535 [Tanacetum coccineum]
MMDEYKEIDEIGLSTEDGVSTDGQRVSTDFEKVSTDKPKLSTDDLKVSTDEQMESNDDQVDASEEIFEGTEDQREGTEEKVESTAEQKESTEEQTKEEIATQTSQTSTQTPTSMIFDKGKKKIEEEDETESEDDDIPQAVKKFKQLESDEELARKVQEDWQAEEERKRVVEEQAANEALIKDFDDIKARIEADRILAEKLQEQEREQFTIEERAKLVLKIATDEDKEADYEILDRKYPIIDWKIECLGTKPQLDEAKTNEEIILNVVTRRVVIHMLTEKKYPLKKEILVQMLNLKLESEEESTMALELIRFITGEKPVIKKGKHCYSQTQTVFDEELSIPEQTTTGKGTSNPLMAGSLPKTTKPT